jgi:hypothetical protein
MLVCEFQMRLLRIAVLSMGVCLCVPGQDASATKDIPTTEAKPIAPRAAATDYPSQGKAGEVTIAAEFVGHAVPTPDLMLNDEDYVVVEVAFFGAAGSHIPISFENFSLRVNGKKNPYPSQSFVVLGKSLKDPEWQPPDAPASKKSSSSLNTGGGGGQTDSTPPIIHVPVPLQRSWELRAERASLPGGDRPLPQAGLLFFPYRSRTQSIHSLELIYEGAAGKTTLKMHP